MAEPTIKRGSDFFYNIIYEGNGQGQRVGNFVPFTDNGTINNSCLFENNVSTYLSRTVTSNGSATKCTFSCWVKRDILSQGLIGSVIMMHSNVSTNSEILEFNSSDNLHYYEVTSGTRKWNFATVRTFEDTSKWYHIMVARDTSLSNQDDRIKIYVDGTLLTDADFQDGSGNLDLIKPAQDATGYWNQTTYDAVVGNTNNGSYIDGAGYLAEVNMVDGAQLSPSTFGLTDTSTSRWIPKTLSGITYGTNGFRFQFANTAGQTIGDDTSLNGNDFTVNNLTTSNITTDSPTQNHAVIGENGFTSISEGRLKAEGSVSNQWRTGVSSLGMTSGKYYWEVKVIAHTHDNFLMFGICNESTISYLTAAANRYPGLDTNSGSYSWQPNASGDDDMRFNGSVYRDETGTTIDNNDILQFAYDADLDRLWVGKNNTYLYSGNPANGTNYTLSGIGNREARYAAFSLHNNTSQKVQVNFGQSSFAYTPPSGFVALQQDNLPETGKSIPDFSWIKNRDATDNYQMYDTSRGVKQALTTEAGAETTVADGLQKFLKGGFEIEDDVSVNSSGESYVAWNWIANGGTTTANTDGSGASIASTTQANQTAGFSIVTYTGSGSAGTIAHGLSSAPEWVMASRRNDSSGDGWTTYHIGMTDANYWMDTRQSNGQNSASIVWNGAAPTNKVFSVGTSTGTNTSSKTYVAYCWHSVPGYSKFGKYTANNSANGPFIYTGFKPRWLLIKSLAAISWYIIDATRSPINPVTNGVSLDNPQVEFTNQFIFDFLSNGFKIRNNNSGYGASNNSTSHDPYIYCAFAEHPFIGSGSISPVTAR